jgi:transcriptional regulator with XRE-family HTH domain
VTVTRPRRPRRHILDLAWLRYDLGISQQRVADLFGISMQKLRRLENDHGTVEEIVAYHVLLNAYGLMWAKFPDRKLSDELRRRQLGGADS